MADKIIPPTPCRCDFCGMNLTEVHKMARGRVGGFWSYICDDCVIYAYNAMGIKSSESIAPALSAELHFRGRAPALPFPERHGGSVGE